MNLLLALSLSLSASSRAAEAPKEVRVGYFANVTHAQAILGVARGDFQKALGATALKTRIFNAGPALIEAMNAGDIDLGYVGPSPAVNAFVRSRGEGVRIIAGAAANGAVIVASKASGIRKLEDLKGKRLATPQLGNTQDVAARRYLKAVLDQSGLQNVLPIPNADQVAMMARGQIDAAWVPEPWGARLLAEGDGVLVAEEKDLWDGKKFSTVVLVTTPEFLKKHPETAAAFLKAHVALTKEISAAPKKQAAPLAAALKALTGKELKTDIIAEALGRVQFTEDPLEATIVTMAGWAYDLRFLPEPPNLAGLFDTALLRFAAAEPKSEPKKGKSSKL